MAHDECVSIQRAARLARDGCAEDALILLTQEAKHAGASQTGKFAAFLIEAAKGASETSAWTEFDALPTSVRVVAIGLCWWAEDLALIRAPGELPQEGDLWVRSLVGRAKAKAHAGDKDGALRLFSESVEHWRERAVDNNDAAARLAEALRLSAVVASGTGREREALALAAEACRLYRACCDAGPLEYLGHWASALHNLAGLRLLAGRAGDAVTTARSSISLRREGAKFAPAYFAPDLVVGLAEGSRILANAELFEEAGVHADEAVALARTLVMSRGEAGSELLSLTLRARSEVAMLAHDWAAGYAAISEEIAQLRADQENDPALAATLADALHNQATFLTMLGRDAEAAASLQESLSARPQGAERSRPPSLFMAGVLAARSGDGEGAIAHFSEAASAFEALGEETDVAETCLALADTHADAGRLADALAATQRAIDASESGARGERGPKGLESYARSLVRLGDLHRRARQDDEAVAAYRQAASLRRKLRAVGVSGEVAAVAAYKLIACLRRAGRHEEGEAWRQRFKATDLH